MNIYLIPGLGADRRMYLHQLKVLPGAEVIEHFLPLKSETLVSYSERIA